MPFVAWKTLQEFIAASQAPAGRVFFLAALGGMLAGALCGGLVSAWAAYVFARRLFRHRILNHARQDIKGPLNAYVDWLGAVSGEFALWKTSLLPCYVPDSPQDEFELNRMRKLFVDERNALWAAKLEEYGSLLAKFHPAIKGLWLRQKDMGDSFHRIFRYIESDPPEAVNLGEALGERAFEQSRLVADLLYQLQYECVRMASSGRLKAPKDMVNPRIVRTRLGRIRLVTPAGAGEKRGPARGQAASADAQASHAGVSARL